MGPIAIPIYPSPWSTPPGLHGLLELLPQEHQHHRPDLWLPGVQQDAELEEGIDRDLCCEAGLERAGQPRPLDTLAVMGAADVETDE